MVLDFYSGIFVQLTQNSHKDKSFGKFNILINNVLNLPKFFQTIAQSSPQRKNV